MTQLPATEDYQPTSYYHWAQEGRPHEHCVGTSCDNLVAMSVQDPADCQQAPAAASGPRLQQPTPTAPKPFRSEPVESAAGSEVVATSLDQYAPMLPSNPVQQLPLLPATCTSATVRVAAWLLDQSDHDHACNNNVAGQGVDAADGSADGASSCEEGQTALPAAAVDAVYEEVALLHEESSGASRGAAAANGGAAAAATATAVHHASAGGGQAVQDCEGYRPTDYYCDARRRSLDAFMSQPVQHGDALNNYISALY